MSLLHVLILAIVQGLAELLPVSSSAHVILAEKLMGFDPSAPEMTFLLVMLHTGTMFAVIVYFWKSWKKTYFSTWQDFKRQAFYVILATGITGVLGLTLQAIIKHVFFGGASSFEIEHLFSNSKLMAAALATVGIIIIIASRFDGKQTGEINFKRASIIGAVQAFCLPFRGFSRSGATISTSLFLGISRQKAEEFSFALAIVLTPAVIVKEFYRLIHSQGLQSSQIGHLMMPSLFGMVFSFFAGLAALKWLSSWLEHGRWYLFGIYCLAFSVVVLLVS
ncbi:undecaprenyl-diphosphate phosphatase [Acinetobacter gerneri]|uniref:Undecaprenyl-diphosphatase n=1 Tax=Acinetobacter gerneri TaxID=202952 RepID=A0AAW8JDF5_9GAMM|nr:undecaprenyl-diphosphate phosphatase [Acinetobacter gerneri]MDQ9008616.1 undecaprenyl-diphosphate phosphatase [Acinetobacter gerneri]MDQ9012836.1 undecaprenyl-diphosphate phosphatase [Acinetobacter gerneri]MDQ9024155.1 undecaprenyl-diphosphate phosphatase [Acinetobacter gerneri]MDQ9051392.1 undecaprenyl-diphosphate phosphatase [Acinetobacter gerneri]MDQ9058615.1 undecaprenyl-diphosphate phosphatase [Acinetobacter gerneri]